MITDFSHLSVSERIQLVEDIWDTIAALPEELPVTQDQREVLDSRIEEYRRNPHGGVSWQEVQAKIKSR